MNVKASYKQNMNLNYCMYYNSLDELQNSEQITTVVTFLILHNVY